MRTVSVKLAVLPAASVALSTTLRRLRLPIARSPAFEALNVSVPAPAFVSEPVFVAAVFAPLAKVMRAKREQTSALVQIQENALIKHRAVLDAIRSGDAEASRAAMADHIAQTAEDLRRYVLPPRE